MTALKCDCGTKTSTLYYKNGKKTCSNCATLNLSGTFLRRLEGEARYYAKDILQPNDLNFAEVYGKGKNISHEQRKIHKRS